LNGTSRPPTAPHGLILALSRLTDATVISNARWTFLGNVLYAASQWAMVVVLARSTNAQTVGTLALALAITAPVTILFNMQLRAVIATDVTGKYALRDYFHTRLITTAGALVVILPCILIFHASASTASVIVLIALSKASESFSDVIHGYWQLVERMEFVGKSLTVRAVLTLGAFTLAITTTRSLVWGSAAFLLASACTFFGYDLTRVRRAGASLSDPRGEVAAFFDLSAITRRSPAALVTLAAPLGVAAMFISLNSAIPRYFIELYSGKRQLGIFSALSYFIVVGGLCMNAVGQSVLPRLAKLYKLESRAAFRQMLAGLLTCSGAISLASMGAAFCFGRQLLLIYGKEYADAYPAFLVIMGAASVGYFVSVLNFSLNAIGAYKPQTPLFLTTTLLLIASCRVLVPAHGIVGAAVALAMCGAIQAALAAVLLVLRARTPGIQT
jgi:O-antigen/teichoic acid export membrane protein